MFAGNPFDFDVPRGFEMFAHFLTQDQPDSYFRDRLTARPLTRDERERVFYAWGAAIAHRKRDRLRGSWDGYGYQEAS